MKLSSAFVFTMLLSNFAFAQSVQLKDVETILLQRKKPTYHVDTLETHIFYDVAVSVKRQPSDPDFSNRTLHLLSTSLFNSDKVGKEICLAKGYDDVVKVRMTSNIAYKDLIGKEIVRYSKGKMQKIIVPNQASMLLGTLSVAAIDRLSYARHDFNTVSLVSWNQIQHILIMPYISSIECKKNNL